MSNTRKTTSAKPSKSADVDVDLDAARRQRAEASDTTPVVVQLGGQRFAFPATVDDVAADLIDLINAGDVTGAIRSLMSEEQWAAFSAQRPTLGDLKTLFADLSRRYGLGESPASST